MQKVDITNLLTVNAGPIREWLDGGNLRDVKQIHRLRVCIKKLRSLLKLIRDLSGSDISLTRINDSLKAMSHCLSGQRDYDVVSGILHDKAEKEEDVAHRESFVVIQKLLGQAVQMTVPEPAQVHHSGQIVVAAIGELPPIELPKKQLAEYLSGRSRRMCKKGHKVLASAGCVQLHKLRKRVKTLFYQLKILSDAGFDMGLPTKKLKKLGNRLGKIHDYCVLEKMLDELRNNDATGEKIQQADWQRVQEYSNAQRQQYLAQSSKLHRKWCRRQKRVAEKA